MNLALPALIGFAVLLPGFIFRAGLKRTESESLDFSPFGKVAADAVLCAAVLHGAWLLCTSLLGRQFQPLLLLQLLSSHPATQAQATGAVAGDVDEIAAYFMTLLLAAYAIPVLIRGAILGFKLDREGARFSSFFRFYDAPWYYLLTGADFIKTRNRTLSMFLQLSRSQRTRSCMSGCSMTSTSIRKDSSIV